MNLRKIEKAIKQAERKLAFKKLGNLRNFVFYDKEKKCYRLVYNVFVKKGEDESPKQKAEMERIEKLCADCGIDCHINIFIDDLGDEFEETE